MKTIEQYQVKNSRAISSEEQQQAHPQQPAQQLKNGAPIGNDKGRPQPANSASSIDSSGSTGGISGVFPANLSPSPQAGRTGTPSQPNSTITNKTPFSSSSPSPGLGANSAAGSTHAYDATSASVTSSSKSDSIVTSSASLSSRVRKSR